MQKKLLSFSVAKKRMFMILLTRPAAYFTCWRTARLLFWAGECNERFQTSVFS
jgi:hypothetical protein